VPAVFFDLALGLEFRLCQQQPESSSARAARGLDSAADDGRMGVFGASSTGPRQRCWIATVRQQQLEASSVRAARGLDSATDDGRMGFFSASSTGPRQRCWIAASAPAAGGSFFSASSEGP